MRRNAGMTLMEVMIAVSLLSVLSVGMMLAMRLGISALNKVDRRLMDNRRVAGAQRIVEQQIEGMIPAIAPCSGNGGNQGSPKVAIFSGQPNSVTLVSSFSLQEAWRGRPQVLQMFVGPGEEAGVRLLVNEIPYTGPSSGQLCANPEPDGETSGLRGRFAPPSTREGTFVLADHLRSVRFEYLKRPEKVGEPGLWITQWTRADWPAGIRIVMEPIDPNPARLQPVTVTAPVFFNRTLGVQYEDQ
jgi:prepilin-type N-terminal cleavage/methylation domain-containing protein